MAKTPATPEKPGKSCVKYSATAVAPCKLDSSSANTMSNEHEPSPASTYGLSAVGDSAPVTPQDVHDPAIIASSHRTTGGMLGGSISHGIVLGSHSISPKKTPVIARYTASRSTSVSAVSSPRASRTRDIHEAVSWRGERDTFDTSHVDSSDIFGLPACNTENFGSAIRPSPTVIKGVPVTNDNAQALLPPTACVFVANLASSRTDEQLEQSVTRIFEQYGRVYVKIRRDQRGMPYAFCQYENVSDSELAIEKGRGVVIDGRHCRTERAKAHRSLYLSRITGGPISEEEAYQVLEKFGSLEKIWMSSPTDKEMFRLPDGIWVMWTYFQGARDAQSAFKEHPKYRLEEPSLPVDTKSRERAKSSSAARANHGQFLESPQQRVTRALDRTSLYVGGLPANVTQTQLCALFTVYGTVRGVEIISKMMNNGSGICVFAFVEMTSEEDVKRAANQEFTLEGVRLRVEIKHSPAHMAHRSYHTVSTGSPRRRNERASPETIGDMVSSALVMSRALAAGVHPAVASYISGTSNTLSLAPPANTVTHSALPIHQMAQIYPQVTYDAPFHTNQFGHFGSPSTNSEDGASSGRYPYPPVNYHGYPLPGPVIYPQPAEEGITSASAVRANLQWEV